MIKKCPNCNHECEEFDIYCSRCGAKLGVQAQDIQIPNKEVFDIEGIFDNGSQDVNIKNKGFKTFNIDKNNIFSKNLFNYLAGLFIVCTILLSIFYYIVNVHSMKKSQLQFNNMINNPQLIPELKEPENLTDLLENFDKNQKFLLLYLKYSKDSIEKKEQIFAAYLNEMEKVSHLSNENLIKDEGDKCFMINSAFMAKKCSAKYNKDLKKIGIVSYPYYNGFYLYSDNDFIYKTYSKYLSNPMKNYLKLRAKYNTPVNVGVDLYISPKKLANKLSAFEKMYLSVQNQQIKDSLERILYDDFRKFIFTPSIYATTTQEMKPEFKKAYSYYIKSKKDSALSPVIMSYLDKKRAYSEENFKNDYPYKLYMDTFEENVQNNVFSDIFIQLRKSAFSNNNNQVFTHIYNLQNGSWQIFDNEKQIQPNQYVITGLDENNNALIYNNTFSLIQEINIPKYSKIYLVSNGLYVYNSDRLSLSKIMFNGRNFTIKQLSQSEIYSLFPGINIINIDSYSNYNISIKKDNEYANYIILSKYSQGYNGYILTPTQGDIKNLVLPNMFSIATNDEVIISYHKKDVNPDEISESSPSYRFVIRTNDMTNPEKEDNIIQYDEKTKNEEEKNPTTSKPNIMPKISDSINNAIKTRKEDIQVVPEQTIEPPKDND